MEGLSWKTACLSALCIFLFLRPAAAIRFVIDREDCFSHNVEYVGDTVHVSFVVIKADTPWHYSDKGADLVVRKAIPFSWMPDVSLVHCCVVWRNSLLTMLLV
jgi:p24 family protein beta-1